MQILEDKGGGLERSKAVKHHDVCKDMYLVV